MIILSQAKFYVKKHVFYGQIYNKIKSRYGIGKLWITEEKLISNGAADEEM